MTDNLIALLIGLTLLWGMFFATAYGTYRYGRYIERRALAVALKDALTDAYGDGYKDGETKGRTKGWIDGMKECDTVPLFSGRY